MKKKEKQELKEKIRKIREWSSSITTEFSKYNDEKILWTQDMENLYRQIKTTKNGDVVLLLGLQGIGKTVTIRELSYKLFSENKKVLPISWGLFEDGTKDATSDSIKGAFNSTGFEYYGNEFIEFYADNVIERLKIKYPKSSRDVPGYIKKLAELIGESEIDLEEKVKKDLLYYCKRLELLLSTKERKNILLQSFHSYLATFNVLFVDLPDYKRGKTSEMSRDIKTISILFGKWNENKNTILVLTTQSEIGEYVHYFQGKSHSFHMKPLTDDEILKVFKLNFCDDVYPFTESAIKCIGQISRGVMRRFKRNLSVVLDKFEETNEELITSEFVENSLTFKTKLNELQRELMPLYKTELSRILVVRILEVLRKHDGKMTQQNIIDKLDHSASYISKIIRDLTDRGYVKRVKKWDGSRKYYEVILI